MKRRNLAAAVAAATAVAVIPAAGAVAATSGTDGRTVLPNSGTPQAKGLALHGAPATSKKMTFTLQLPLRNQGLAKHLAATGVVLSPSQYRAYFSPSAKRMHKVTKWAKKQGFSVVDSSRMSGQVTVRSSVAHVNSAFKVTMHRASLDGVSGLAVNKAPSVPTSLGLSGVAGLNSVHRMRTNHIEQPSFGRALAKKSAHAGGLGQHVTPLAGGTDGSRSCAKYWGEHLYPKSKKYNNESNVMCGYTPADLQKLYGAQAYKSTAPKLGILLWNNNPDERSQTNTYMKKYDFKTLAKAKYHVTAAKYSNNPACGSGLGEQDLDVQSTHAIAPNASIYYYGAASCLDGDLTAMLQKAVDAHKVTTLSMSFGTSSDAGMTKADKNAWDRPLLQAHLTGISVFASTGDSGDNSRGSDDGKKHVGEPASSYYLTAVGGTSAGMKKNGSMGALAGWEDGFYSQESPTSTNFPDITSEEDVYGAGGGVSETWTRPAWQKGHVDYKGKMRAVPDIGAVADPFTGYTIYSMNNVTNKLAYQTFGGTSLASPVMAALVGLGKQAHHYKVGNIAPKLYQLAGTSAIKDVNAPNKAGVYYPFSNGQGVVIGFDTHHQSLVTNKGWDNVTGVGTPNGAAFIKAIKK